MNFFKCTFSLISKEWKYHFCLSDWRNLYCVSGFPSHSSGTLLHGFIFHSISSSSTAQLFLKCLSFPFLNEGKKINPIFLWDDLCERLIYIHCLPVLISYSLSLHSFLHLRVTALSSRTTHGTISWFPFSLWANLLSRLRSCFYPRLPLNVTVCSLWICNKANFSFLLPYPNYFV